MSGFEGEVYATEGRLDVVEIAKRMRTWIKAARALGAAGGGIDLPAEARVAVRIDRASMCQGVNVTISAPAEWLYVAPGAPHSFLTDVDSPRFGGRTVAAQVAVRVIEHELGRYNRDNSDTQSDIYDVWFSPYVSAEPIERVREDSSMAPVPGVWGPDVDAAVEATPYMRRQRGDAAQAVETAAAVATGPMTPAEVFEGATAALGAEVVGSLTAALLGLTDPAPIRRRGHLALVHSA